MKPWLSLVLAFTLAAQSAFASPLDVFYCRRLLDNRNPLLITELLHLKRFGRSDLEVLKVYEDGKQTVDLKDIVDPDSEILFGWQMRGMRPLLTLYFHNLEVQVTLYPRSEGLMIEEIHYTVKETAVVEKGVYFVAKFAADKIAQAVRFVHFLKSAERVWKELNHTYTNQQRIADVDKLFSFFFLEPTDAGKKLKVNHGELTQAVMVGNISRIALRDRLKAANRWRLLSNGEPYTTKDAVKVLLILSAVGMGLYFTYSSITDVSR